MRGRSLYVERPSRLRRCPPSASWRQARARAGTTLRRPSRGAPRGSGVGCLEVEEASRALGAARLSEAQRAAVDQVTQLLCLLPRPGARFGRSPTQSGLMTVKTPSPTGWRVTAPTSPPGREAPLAESAITSRRARRARGSASRARRSSAALRWLVAGCATHQLASEIEAAASRIHNLRRGGEGLHVRGPGDDAQAGGRRPGSGRHAFAVLTAQRPARDLSAVSLDVEADLPRIPGPRRRAQPGVGEPRRQRARRARSRVAALRRAAVRETPSSSRVVDDGAWSASRRFAGGSSIPFFTTKAGRPVAPVLGLDIASGASCTGTRERSRSTPAPGTRSSA